MIEEGSACADDQRQPASRPPISDEPPIPDAGELPGTPIPDAGELPGTPRPAKDRRNTDAPELPGERKDN